MYRPGKHLQPGPKLLSGACRAHVLLPLACRQMGRMVSSPVHVERYVEGWVLIDLPALEGSGAWLEVTVEGSRDTQRWADIEARRYYLPGYYRLAVSNLGAYLRVTCAGQGSLQCGIEFVGKSFEVGGLPRAPVR